MKCIATNKRLCGSTCSRRVGRWGIPSYSSKISVSKPNNLRDFKLSMAPKNSSVAALEGKLSRLKRSVGFEHLQLS
jgi:hypothetical protein